MVTVQLHVQHDVVDPEAIDVWVDCFVGDAPVRFRLDTGAWRCRVATSDATRDLPSSGVDKGVGASGTGLGEDLVAIPLLRIGDLDIVDVAATRTPGDADVSPLLGMSALGRFRCLFRFSTGHMELAHTDPIGTDNWFELSVHAAGQPTVAVCFDDVEVVACWDTGAGLTAVDTEFARAHSNLFEPVRDAIGVDASGVHMPTHIARMKACTIGGIPFAPGACAFVDLGPLNAALQQRALEEQRVIQPMSFILGMPVISQTDSTFDFPAGRWTLAQLRPG